jgi:hypothetical protein
MACKQTVQPPMGVQPEEPEPKVWKVSGPGYEFSAEGCVANIMPCTDGHWHMVVHVGAKHYYGNRPTLEEAAKATNKLMHDKANEAWSGSHWGVVLAPWQGDLNV